MWPFDKKKASPQPPTPEAVPAAPAGGAAFHLTCAADLGQGPLPVFPLLMSSAAFTPAPNQLARPLIVGPKLPGIPWVMIVHLIPTPGSPAPSRAFLRKERVDQLGKTVKDFEAEALANVALRTATWEVVEPSPGAKMLTCTDDYLAAERILDPAFLRKGHGMLGEKSMVVGIPCRGQLCATPLAAFTQGAAHARTFKMLVEHLHAGAGETAIAPWLFLVIDGTLNSILEVE